MMQTGQNLANTLIDQFNELGLPHMAVAFDSLYRSERFLNLDRMTIIAELIEPEYKDKITKRINNRLAHAKLKGCPEEISKCEDSANREYLPVTITSTLASLNFIEDGMNVCILGPSDSGKTYLAKAIGIAACQKHKVEYYHCEDLIETLATIKEADYVKYERKMKSFEKLDLLILDDFLLHTITDEREIKVLYTILEKRCTANKSTIVCSQREPKSWQSMVLNDEVSANSIMKRATKHYTVVINVKNG